MLRKIKRRFDFNVVRVSDLVKAYQELENSDGGRKRTYSKDVLRAAVVMLHATLEDLVRGLIASGLPKAPARAFDKIPFNTEDGDKLAVDLSVLARHRGKTVDEVLGDAVAQYLSRKTFNNVGEIKGAMTRIGVDPVPFKDRFDSVVPMMERRHAIVHRSDRLDLTDDDHGRPRNIEKKTVEEWRDAVDDLGQALIRSANGGKRVSRRRKVRRRSGFVRSVP